MSKKEEQKLALQKMLTGHFIETVPDGCKKKVVYVLQGDGVWEVRRNNLGTFTHHVAEIKIPGLASDLESGWQLDVPKIPGSMLDITLAFFRKIYDKHSSEVFVQFFYDTEVNEYIIYCPKQVVGPASVRYTRDQDFETKEKILVFEIHSHGSMSAFFSGTDDGDEKGDRFFGVIGNVNKFYPEIQLRLSIGGRKVEVDIPDVFEIDDSASYKVDFPVEWVEKIKKAKIKKIKKKKKDKGIRTYSGRGGLGDRGHDWRLNHHNWRDQEPLFTEEEINAIEDDHQENIKKMFGADYLYPADACVDDDNDDSNDVLDGRRLVRGEDGNMYNVKLEDDGSELWEEIDDDFEGAYDDIGKEGVDEESDEENETNWRGFKW